MINLTTSRVWMQKFEFSARRMSTASLLSPVTVPALCIHPHQKCCPVIGRTTQTTSTGQKVFRAECPFKLCIAKRSVCLSQPTDLVSCTARMPCFSLSPNSLHLGIGLFKHCTFPYSSSSEAAHLSPEDKHILTAAFSHCHFHFPFYIYLSMHKLHSFFHLILFNDQFLQVASSPSFQPGPQRGCWMPPEGSLGAVGICGVDHELGPLSLILGYSEHMSQKVCVSTGRHLHHIDLYTNVLQDS